MSKRWDEKWDTCRYCRKKYRCVEKWIIQNGHVCGPCWYDNRDQIELEDALAYTQRQGILFQ